MGTRAGNFAFTIGAEISDSKIGTPLKKNWQISGGKEELTGRDCRDKKALPRYLGRAAFCGVPYRI